MCPPCNLHRKSEFARSEHAPDPSTPPTSTQDDSACPRTHFTFIVANTPSAQFIIYTTTLPHNIFKVPRTDRTIIRFLHHDCVTLYSGQHPGEHKDFFKQG